jgi:UDP-N-acetylmuramoyl-tripeptide--D-alanyl-D-alanine ligase
VQRDSRAEAREHRARLTNVTFIGITGSCGKTTTKDLAAGLLAGSLRGSANPGSGNCGADVVRQVLGVQPGDDYCVQELGAWGPGTLDAGLDLIRPRIGVVLNVRRDHYSAFHGLEHTRAEKQKLIERLPADGTAILNADDPQVRAMRAHTQATIVTFGTRPGADFHVRNRRASWPDTLAFELSALGVCYDVRTRLIGEHLAGSAAAALAIAHTMGVPLDVAVARLATLPPTERRMSALALDTGVSFVRDDFKATSDSLDELLTFLAAARAARKIVIVGQISDHPGRSRPFYTAFARAAAPLVDRLVFVGERAADLWEGARRSTLDAVITPDEGSGRIAIFRTVRDASQHLRGEWRAGDLVVLKGSGPSDHLERILLDDGRRVRCWRAHCGLVVSCDSCEWLSSPADLDEPVPARIAAI